MSRFSGRCDLYDTICMRHPRTKEGKDDKESLRASPVWYSDELECFEDFKKETGGVMYQHKKVKVTRFNQDLVAKMCPGLKIVEHKNVVKDKRYKSGEKEVVTYTYEYYGTEYPTLDALNKQHVYVRTEIHFETLLDVIPYYGYVVASACYSDGHATIYLARKSEPDAEYEEGIDYGFDQTRVRDYYKRELQKHYIEVVALYYADEAKRIMDNREKYLLK